LGYSSIIKAFPYEIPSFLPPILVEFASISSKEFNELSKFPSSFDFSLSVRKTFAEFRKMHSDQWHIQQSYFTEDQLSILNDLLVSPSYYA
jgi:proteasome activator subunit 4